MIDDALIGPATAPDLHVMSFNIRRRFARLPTRRRDRWETRRPLVHRLLAAEQPTILGVQEAFPEQSEAVGAALGSRYRSVGGGRDADGGGEGCPLFFDADRLALTEWRQLALSATPAVPGSCSWGNRVPRVVVVAELVDAATRRRVVAMNTHLDHLSHRSRLHSAAMLVALADQALAADPTATVVLTGDVNAGERSSLHRALAADGVLRDAWYEAPARITPRWRTFSNYRAPRSGGRRIDLVLVGPGVEVRRVGINAVRFEGAAASDHEPVQALVRPSGGAR